MFGIFPTAYSWPRALVRAALGALLFTLAAPALPAQTSAVFCTDGAGDFKISSTNLRKVAAADHLPLEVRPFYWSHGSYRVLSDQMRYSHTCARGQQLAEEILRYHLDHPATPICLYAHSAGCTVALKALETLPPGLVHSAVLLSPSLSAAYDLRPALDNLQCGLYVFYSRRDYWYLGMTTRLVGTADRHFSWCSGRFGFDVDAHPLDEVQRAKLHQRPWQRADRALGNNGGHYGNYQPAFLRAYIVPRLLQ